ncbi:MAG: hypothetical protein KIT84_11700 [Labilithrix sp.]|nr:hypothetical protein [Labilithrix sp.]MCW5811674.1 hypothetical protein [Labilithrix sp.]
MFRSFLVLSVAAGVVLAVAACGDKTTVVMAAAACDSAKCLPGNTCLPFAGETKCRKTCGSNDEPETSCPLGYICMDTDPGAGVPPFCVQNTAGFGDGDTRTPVTPQADGQWGTPCQANLGVENPACDTAQGFYCYATSPSDGNAYCTTYGCESNTDCGAGFGCESINNYPNANTAKRRQHGASATQKACVRRAYCSECASDIDCPALAGVKQYCIPDASDRWFCTPECTSTQGCPNEAACRTLQFGDEAVKVCYPRSQLCIGDGELCSPCRSDLDCGEDGVCTKGEYTTERFCAKAAPGGDCAQCPKSIPGLPKRGIGCSRAESDKLPKDYCTGLVSLQGREGSDIGCWTPDR